MVTDKLQIEPGGPSPSNSVKLPVAKYSALASVE